MIDEAELDDDSPARPRRAVIGSIAAAVGPLPFLLVYSVIFIAHGFFYPVQPPDITSTRTRRGRRRVRSPWPSPWSSS